MGLKNRTQTSAFSGNPVTLTVALMGLIGLVLAFPVLVGCPRPLAFLNGQEMIGEVTGTKATIRLVAGNACTPSSQFRLLYDTTSREDPNEYAFQTTAVSGFSGNDPINFDLTSLPGNSRIYYRVAIDMGRGWEYRDEYTFHTKRSGGHSFRFCIASDAHVRQPPLHFTVHRSITYANVAADHPDLFFALGDDIELAGQGPHPYLFLRRQQTVFATLQRYRGVTDEACGSTSCLFVNGNHEGLFGWTSGTRKYQWIREGKLDYFPVPNRSSFPEGGDDDGRYGAFTWGDVLFVWLDVVGFCQTDPWPAGDNQYYILGDAQRSFLQTTLANSTARWKFVLSHHLFGGVEDCGLGYGRGNANGAYLHDQAHVQNLMVQYGVQAFFYGHDHVFSVSEADGVSYIATGHAGGGGGAWTELLLSCYEPYLIFPTDDGIVPAGHVRVDVSHDEATVSYIRASRESDNRSVIASYVLTP